MTSRPTPARLAGQAAEAIRALNHATRGDGLEYPADVYEVVASLKLMEQRLPQLYGQLASFLAAENEAGRVAHDMGEPSGPYVTETIAALADAKLSTAATAEALDAAHNACAGLKRDADPQFGDPGPSRDAVDREAAD